MAGRFRPAHIVRLAAGLLPVTRPSDPIAFCLRRREVLDIAQELTRWLDEGREFTVATVVGVSGSAPRELGATLAVDRDGTAVALPRTVLCVLTHDAKFDVPLLCEALAHAGRLTGVRSPRPRRRSTVTRVSGPLGVPERPKT